MQPVHILRRFKGAVQYPLIREHKYGLYLRKIMMQLSSSSNSHYFSFQMHHAKKRADSNVIYVYKNGF